MRNLLTRILRTAPLLHLRRNHALEHATIHLLSARYPRRMLVGRSDIRGFSIYGSVPTFAVEQAVYEALSRLRSGQRTLAIHPNCGTNLMVSGLLAGTAAFLSVERLRRTSKKARLADLPTVVALTMLALGVSWPLGATIQKQVTTEADLAALEVLSVRRWIAGPVTIHRVLTHNGDGTF